MTRLLTFLRSPITRWTFLAVALGFAVWFVWANAAQIRAALAQLDPRFLIGALVASVVYVLMTMEAWRQVVRDLGHRLTFRSSIPLFGISQLGKYIPGGVWNIAAAAELGRAHGIPARHSVAAMTIALLISIVSGTAIGALGFLASPAPIFAQWGWVFWVALPLVVLLFPPVMNRAIAFGWRIARLESLDTRSSLGGLALVTVWSAAGWVVAGASVSLLAIGMGAPATWLTLAQCIGGYALAWVVGFLIVVAPAGAGVRELVLAACLVGTVDEGAVVAIVLISRLLLTGVDLSLAGVGAIDARLVKARQPGRPQP
jgi:uncharacterized membrane protein YbhN (UPF0104 family)